MSQSYLKPVRLIISLVFFLFITFILLDFHELVSPGIIAGVLSFQFIPSVLKFITLTSVTAGGFILLLVMTALFGRVYCSSLCPLGTFQDIINWLQAKLNRKHRFRYNKPVNYLRYGLLILTAALLASGSIFLVNLLDPYSNYGRIASDLLRPAYIGLNNLVSGGLERMNVYFLYPQPVHLASSWLIYLYPLIVLTAILWLSLRNGRLFCNLICPVGSLMGLVSKRSLFQIRMIESSCTQCGKCAVRCKSACISVKNMTVDFTRCVACYNCIKVCQDDAIKYTIGVAGRREARKDGGNRRQFFRVLMGGMAGFFGMARQAWAQEAGIKNKLPTVVRDEKTCPVTPPGSLGIDHFTGTCTACHLCVSACPTDVIQPSLFEYGITGIMQPHMDYHTNYCNFECTTCSEVCPTGAILPVRDGKKETLQLGQVQLILENCVVYTENTACGSCAEHCPTKAVRMIPYIDDLTIPDIRPEICVGCGACEYACPTRPYRAIFVDGHFEHQVAQKPEIEEMEEVELEDFPF